jgi:hypothetical protein
LPHSGSARGERAAGLAGSRLFVGAFNSVGPSGTDWLSSARRSAFQRTNYCLLKGVLQRLSCCQEVQFVDLSLPLWTGSSAAHGEHLASVALEVESVFLEVESVFLLD